MNLLLHLRIVGVLLLVLLAMNVVVWKRYGWKAEIQRLELLTRQVFIVHSFFIMLTIAWFAAISLFYGEALLAPGPLAQVVLAGLVVFWGSRLIIQWFVYDSRLWRGRRMETFIHIAFSLMWAYFTLVYGAALAQQFASV
ncbi:MAG: hypothetical protein WD768_20310 [Phycisphaeraceae bacterium]